jgi:hypothetical protein
MMRRPVVLALLLLAVAAPARAEPSAPGASTPAIARPAAPPPIASEPSALADTLRAGGATVLVVLLLGGVALAWRRRRAPRPAGSGPAAWWRRWLPALPAEGDRIEMLTRLSLGTRESLALVRIGRERLLVSVTASQIALLTRLDPAEAPPAAAPATDFPSALAAAAVSVPRTSDDLREALARSRIRLDRLSGRRVNEAAPRA